jgi:hypothetical protein
MSTAASAAGPPVPDGCTFDHGVRTCATTSSETVTEGPFTTPGSTADTIVVNTPTSTLFGDFTGLQICQAAFSPVDWARLGMSDVTVSGVVTTTTETRAHGVRGPVFDSSASTSSSVSDVGGGTLGCIR